MRRAARQRAAGRSRRELQSALTKLATAYDNLQKAFKSGDVAAIGQAQTAVNQAAADGRAGPRRRLTVAGGAGFAPVPPAA